jgi:hypothetical protein
MDGLFDMGNNNILIAGDSAADHLALVNRLAVGDIAVYMVSASKGVIHRIVRAENDEVGEYFVFLGDNNQGIEDSYRVRRTDIKWIWIGTIP